MTALGVYVPFAETTSGPFRRSPVHRKWARLVAFLGAAYCLFLPSLAFAAFTPPPLDGHIADTAHVLSPEDVSALDASLERFRLRTGFGIVVFVAGSLEGEPIEDVAYEAFNTWKVGRKGKDDGVLLVIAPNERKVQIETGKGVGGALTDLQANDIIRQEISPALRQGLYRQAIERGTSAIERALVSDSDLKPERPRARPASPVGSAVIGIGLLVFIVLLIVSPTFRAFVLLMIWSGGRGGGGGFGGGDGGGGGFGGGDGGGDGGSGYSGEGGSSGGGGSGDSY